MDKASRADAYNSPGWRRMQARSAQLGVSQPREGVGLVIDSQGVSSFGMHDRVFDQKFGYGAVVGIEGDKLEISFDKAGIKKVVASYVTLPDEIPF